MRVLIIGSLAGELGQAARIAMQRGARLDQADDADQGLIRLRADARVDLVLCDVAQDVGAVVAALVAERMAVPVVAAGTGDDPEAVLRAIRAGAREFLPLPPDPDLIAAILEAASGESHTMVVRDPVMATLVRRAEQVARSEASVLICGESGTGKEVLARHIHRRSRRTGGPFVALNCAAIPENLLESELFGHEKGAFSGAVARRVGKFEAADRGTLLLDEISEMDVRLQAKLLRALQEREIDRLGGAAPVKVDVRILATTNRDLLAEVARGTFREDLYYRLNVVALRVPSLRERPRDVAALADHFARKYAEVNGLPYRPLAPAALLRLTGHAWRGNVRELENTLHRAVLLAEGDAIGPEAVELGPTGGPTGTLPGTPSGTLPGTPPDTPPGTPTGSPTGTLAGTPTGSAMGASFGTQPATAGGTPDGGRPVTHAARADGIAALVGRTMEEVERDLIIETLGHTLGNRTHAATILGISIRALRNKLRDYAAQGVPVPPPTAGVAA
ncbi:MAG: sigma-54-dependent Fis family transcriptional regulator [Rhodospirillales bacterium 69-11]|nr:MAG: sigma-54-dependent Fis family transcriptional regulator [Rhodospirillales bacterium 69-11]